MKLRRTYGMMSAALLAVLAACSETPAPPVKEQPEPVTETTGPSAAEIEARRKKAAQELDGYWISDPYLSRIERTRSIYASRKLVGTFFGMTLEEKNLLGNAPALNAFKVHEGGYGGPLVFDGQVFVNDPAQQNELSRIGPVQLKAVSRRRLELYFPQKDKAEFYRKVTGEQTEFRRILLEGAYRTPDNKGRFTFDRTGKVTGFKGQVYCELVYDFGQGINYDALVLFPTAEGGAWNDNMYSFAWSHDTLKLWPIDTDWKSLQHRLADEPLILLKEPANS